MEAGHSVITGYHKSSEIFAHEVSPDLRARNFARSSRESLRKPDTSFDFAQTGHFIGFRACTRLVAVSRHETLSYITMYTSSITHHTCLRHTSSHSAAVSLKL